MHRLHPRILCVILAASLAASAMAAHTPGVQRIALRGDAGGTRFDGIGVVTGGGGTSVLLKDYPEPQRSQLLDLIYKPHFGASVSALYVEIPGDGNATQGSMPSHMHTRDDLDYSRGYLWWEMVEAKKRNPKLTLDGTAWSAPGWIGDQGGLFAQNTGNDYKGDARFFSQDSADYYVSWLRGLREVYGLEMEAVGIRNEKGASYGFAKALRATLDAKGFSRVRLHAFDNWPDKWKFKFVADMENDKALRDAVDIIGAHINAPQSSVPKEVRDQAAHMGKPLWNTEQHVYKAGFVGLIGIVQAFNANWIYSGVTKVVNWYGIAGLYTMESYSGDKEAALRANWPWSGHYEANPALWGYAHYGQFTEPGWEYIAGGSGDLKDGGSYVTLKAPGKDYSIIIETGDARARQQVEFAIGPGLSAGRLAVWRSNASEQFIRLDDLRPEHGVVSLTLDPGSVYSLTTTDGQRKGGFDGVPERKPFPFPYYETFEGYADPKQWGELPRYFADIAGAFELADCPGRQGLCLHQAVPVPPISWAPDWQPYTIIGDDQWKDYEVSADLYLNPGEPAAVMGRVNHVGTGFGFIPKGYFLRLDGGGELQLVVVRGKPDKKKLVGDAEQQALIKAARDDSEGGEKLLARTRLPGIAAGQWHRLALRFDGASITASVDGKRVLSATDSLYGQGMAGLLAIRSGQRLGMPWFDNVLVKPGGAATPAPSAALPGQRPLYPGAGKGR